MKKDGYNEFLKDVTTAMTKHGVHDILIIGYFKKALRNTTLTIKGKGELEKQFNILSDQLDEYFRFMELQRISQQ